MWHRIGLSMCGKVLFYGRIKLCTSVICDLRKFACSVRGWIITLITNSRLVFWRCWKPVKQHTLMFGGLTIHVCDLIFRVAVVMCLLSNIQRNLKEALMMCVFPSLASLSDDAEKWRLQYHISARFIWLEFFYFWAAESFLCPPQKKKLSTYFHFLFFQPVGVVIMEHCGVAHNCLVLRGHSAR